uniref:EF-hand domain-containing protein n=1 Tax=Scleropages formosus TaxID=113540 RepID=A0A8C9TNR5_SCLFO
MHPLTVVTLSISHRLLQRYVKENLKDGQLNPDLTTWEQGKYDKLYNLHLHLFIQQTLFSKATCDTCFCSSVCHTHTEIFFLFSLHDYDRSSNLDGLEMMKLLSDFLSHRSMDPQSGESVSSDRRKVKSAVPIHTFAC